MPLLNSRIPLPTDRAISGSLAGPSTIRAITMTTRISCQPRPGMHAPRGRVDASQHTAAPEDACARFCRKIAGILSVGAVRAAPTPHRTATREPGARRKAPTYVSDLEIQGLHASIDGKEILKGIDLELSRGEIHAVMGPNGSGKSTLANVLMGHPAYEVTGRLRALQGRRRARARARRAIAPRHVPRVPVPARRCPA